MRAVPVAREKGRPAPTLARAVVMFVPLGTILPVLAMRNPQRDEVPCIRIRDTTTKDTCTDVVTYSHIYMNMYRLKRSPFRSPSPPCPFFWSCPPQFPSHTGAFGCRTSSLPPDILEDACEDSHAPEGDDTSRSARAPGAPSRMEENIEGWLCRSVPVGQLNLLRGCSDEDDDKE